MLRDNAKKIAVIADNSRMLLLMHIIVLMGYLDLSDGYPRFLSCAQEKLNRFRAIIVSRRVKPFRLCISEMSHSGSIFPRVSISVLKYYNAEIMCLFFADIYILALSLKAGK